MIMPAVDVDTPMSRLPRGRLPRVLYAVGLDGSLKYGSMEEQMFFLAQAFRAEGSLFLPLFQNPSRPDRTGTAAFEAAGLPTACLSLGKFQWVTLRQLVALIDQHRIQLVHWNFYSPLNRYLWMLSAMRPRLQHYFTDHNSRPVPQPGPPPALTRLVKRALLCRFRKVWCVSTFVQDCLVQQRSWSNLKCCLHFINTDRFCPAPAVRQQVRAAQAVQDKFVVLVVANLIPEKGVDVVLRALKDTPADVVLWVVGTGADASRLEDMSRELQVSERVRFFGLQPQVQPFLQAADCLVCPSLWAEAAGLTNLEGMSTGLPVLASRIGGIPEYVADGQSGFLFPAGDHQALTALLRRLHDDPQECRRLGANGRADMIQRFSVHSKLNEYLDLYRSSN
jgi:glycosyltransferase involved in cell wall biosynthesis